MDEEALVTRVRPLPSTSILRPRPHTAQASLQSSCRPSIRKLDRPSVRRHAAFPQKARETGDARLVTLRFVESDDSALQIDLRPPSTARPCTTCPINSIARLGNFLVARASVQDGCFENWLPPRTARHFGKTCNSDRSGDYLFSSAKTFDRYCRLQPRASFQRGTHEQPIELHQNYGRGRIRLSHSGGYRCHRTREGDWCHESNGKSSLTSLRNRIPDGWAPTEYPRIHRDHLAVFCWGIACQACKRETHAGKT